MKRIALLSLLVMLAGCRGQTSRETPIVGIRNMYDQPRYKPLAKSGFFGDERSARPAVEGTVPRGALQADEHFYAGKVKGKARPCRN